MCLAAQSLHIHPWCCHTCCNWPDDAIAFRPSYYCWRTVAYDRRCTHSIGYYCVAVESGDDVVQSDADAVQLMKRPTDTLVSIRSHSIRTPTMAETVMDRDTRATTLAAAVREIQCAASVWAIRSNDGIGHRNLVYAIEALTQYCRHCTSCFVRSTMFPRLSMEVIQMIGYVFLPGSEYAEHVLTRVCAVGKVIRYHFIFGIMEQLLVQSSIAWTLVGRIIYTQNFQISQ